MPANGRYAYLDTSAFAKLCWPEPESEALREYLSDWPLRVSATLLWTETLRAAQRQSSARAEHAERLLARMALIELDRPLLRQAGLLGPADTRSLDAIHIAAAMSLGSDLGALITYDGRMAVAARLFGLPVQAPT